MSSLTSSLSMHNLLPYLDAHAGVSLAMAINANETKLEKARFKTAASEQSRFMTPDVNKRIGLGLSLDLQHSDWVHIIPSAPVAEAEEKRISFDIAPSLDEVEVNAESPSSLYDSGASPTLLAWALEHPIEDNEEEEEGGFSMRRSYSSLHIIKKEHQAPRTGAAKQPKLCCIAEIDEEADSEYEWLACTAPVSVAKALEWYMIKQCVEGRYELILSDETISYINSTHEEVHATPSPIIVAKRAPSSTHMITEHLLVEHVEESAPAPEPVMRLPLRTTVRVMFHDIGDWVVGKLTRGPRSMSVK